MDKLVTAVNRFVWGIPALLFIIGAGLYVSFSIGFFQFRGFPLALKAFLRNFCKKGSGRNGAGSYRALCTALAATIGTGNLVGVAGAIALGGPGSIFYMWICAILGMGIKYAEAVLAVHFQEKKRDGQLVGGPMYVIKNGLSPRLQWLGKLYCFLGIFAAFGVGNATQVNAIIGGIQGACDATGHLLPKWGNIAIGGIIAALIFVILSGGAKSIGTAAQKIVPFASILYLLLACGVIIIHYDRIGIAFSSILRGAFQPRAVTGGVIGSVFTVLRVGASRGAFTNEAGMGTAGIAHGAAEVSHPAEQGLMGIIEVFLDTIVICTITGLVILISGIPVPYGKDLGAAITADAFSALWGSWSSVLLAGILSAFAFATILGWGLYGARCAEYLLGSRSWRLFTFLQPCVIILGSVLHTGIVWAVAETVNGLMIIPNLIAVIILCPKIAELTKEYQSICKNKK